MPGECRAGSSVYKKTGGRPEDSQNRKCHVMRVTEREDQELHRLGFTNGSVWTRQCTEYVHACPHLRPHPHSAHVCIMCNGLVRAEEDVHWSVYMHKLAVSLACHFWGAVHCVFRWGCSQAKKSLITLAGQQVPGIQSLPPRTETTNSSHSTQHSY